MEKYLTEDERRKMKQDFLNSERKFVKKLIFQKQREQEDRKAQFKQAIDQYEHELEVKQSA